MKSEIARVAHLLAINYSSVTTFETHFFIINGGVQRFSFLNAFSANWPLKIEAGKEARSALEAFKTVHFAFWFPTSKNVHFDYNQPTLVILDPHLGQEVSRVRFRNSCSNTSMLDLVFAEQKRN